MDKLVVFAFVTAVFVAILVGLSAAMAALFWLAWNAVVPGAFGGPELSFWQSWALWVVVSLVGGCFRAASRGGAKS